MASAKRSLITYGAREFARAVTGIASEDSGERDQPNVNWGLYRSLLGGQAEREQSLSSILSRVDLQRGKTAHQPPPVLYHAATPLSLAGTLEPANSTSQNTDGELDELRRFNLYGTSSQAKADSDLNGLWQGFSDEYRQIQQHFDHSVDELFEAFYHLLYKWAWALPCTYGEPGISLFEEWKAIASLALASGTDWAAGPASEFSLIGGDVPGIQEFVYTIASKGAAKGLRGRSLFVQLLGDAIVRRVVVDLGLAGCNVLYNAGGNFMVIGPKLDAQVSGDSVAGHLTSLQRKIDGALLERFEGDLALCLAWIALPAELLGDNAFASVASKDLKQRIADAKHRRFAVVAKEQWSHLFGPQGKPGNRHCVVCQRPLARDEGVLAQRCDPCDGFRQLAEQIAHKGLFVIGQVRPTERGNSWQESLWRSSQIWYDFGPLAGIDAAPGSYFYTVNDTDFLADYAHGFRFLANVTPRITQGDLERLVEEEDEDLPRLGGVRTFSQMARVARGVKQLGVLRMDVDNLGQIMMRGLEPRSMTATSALSAALDRFFSGQLNGICDEINQLHRRDDKGADRGERIYVIYAGGDDVFVVGSWDLMPELALRICRDFRSYCGANPDLRISAGITLEGRSFPLYQAARRAGQAEERAKEHLRRQTAKDAVNFLGVSVKWDEWEDVVLPRWKTIVRLMASERKTAPKALAQVLQDIYLQHDEQVKRRVKAQRDAGKPVAEEIQYQVFYGPWLWRQAYALSRMADRIQHEDPAAAKEVRELQANVLNPIEIRSVGLAARWAELLTREEN